MTTGEDDTAALLDAYVEWMRSWGASRNTIEARISVLGKRLHEWGGVDGVTTANIQRWLATIPEDRPWTRATYHSHIKSLCDWLVATRRLPAHPMNDDKIRSPKRPSGLPRPLTEAQARQVLAAATGDVRAWLILAMYAGLRAHEIAKIRGEDVGEDSIYVRGKGGVEAAIPTDPEVWLLAQRYPRSGYWFPAGNAEGHIARQRVSSRVGQLFRACGIPRGSIHRARHSYATRLLRSGANIRQVQQLMRHASVKTTAGYTAVDEDELRAAVLRLPRLDSPDPPAA